VVSAGCYFALFRPGRVPTGSDIVVMAAAVGSEYSIGWWYARRPLRPVLSSQPGFSIWRWNDLSHGLRTAGQAFWAGRWIAITGLVSYLYIFLQSPLIGILLGNKALGEYRTAGNLINAFQAFAAMIPALLYPRMIEWHRVSPEHLWAKQMRVARLAMCFAVAGTIAIFLLAPHIYGLLYGKAFLEAAYPFALLLVARMIAVVNGIYGWGLWAQHRDGLMLRLTLVAAVVSLPMNYVLIPRFGLMGASGVSVICETLMLFATAGASRSLIRKPAIVPVVSPQTVEPG